MKKKYTTIEVLKNITGNEIYQYDDVQIKYIDDVLCYKNIKTNEQYPMGFTKDIINNWLWTKVNKKTI